MKSLRIGCVKYLNARPLIRGWPGPVDFDHPSTLCKRLANGGLDVAFVSSFEFLRNPIYRIVDDVSISSAGPVYSVVVAHRGDMSEVDEIEIDPAAETSTNLLRCLLVELKLAPRFVRSSASSITPHRARLFIGDQAIRFRQKHATEFHFWDLGEEWKRIVDLPFVYALWLIRPEFAEKEMVAEALRSCARHNLGHLDDLIAETTGAEPDFCRFYFRECLHFEFGEEEKKGLLGFGKLCAKYKLLSSPPAHLNVV